MRAGLLTFRWLRWTICLKLNVYNTCVSVGPKDSLQFIDPVDLLRLSGERVPSFLTDVVTYGIQSWA